jgi:hypothetical protein
MRRKETRTRPYAEPRASVGPSIKVMREKASIAVKLFLLFCGYTLLATALAAGQEQTSPGWQTYDLPFRPLNITSKGHQLWICGADESIAVSSDNGTHWQARHHMADGALLLNIDFPDPKFGYAAGSGGLILTTEDGGETWAAHSTIKDTVLQISFADIQHGLIRTTKSLQFTIDGGLHWSEVSAGQNAADIKKFPYSFSLVALDSSHMGVMLKEGEAQYYAQAFLFTKDSGKSWSFLNLPHVTFYSFLRTGGQYWAVGTDVVPKEQGGNGNAIAAAFFSSDGETWSKYKNDISACQLEMCTVCNTQGCLSSNGVITRIFLENIVYSVFPPEKDLTTKWAATDSTICYVSSRLHCAELRILPQPPSTSGSHVPAVLTPRPLGAPNPPGPQCIFCGVGRFLIDEKVQGKYTIKLVLEVAKNGTVTNVEIKGAPSPEIKSQIEQLALLWLYEPYLKDGAPVRMKINTSVDVNVIRPR